MSSPPVRCPACRRPTARGARFCARCGKDLAKTVETREARSILAAALLYVGVFVAIAATYFTAEAIAPEDPETATSELRWTVLSYGIMVAFGLCALALLGREAWRLSLAGSTDWNGLGMGLLGGGLCFVMSFAYVELIRALGLIEVASETALEGPILLLLLSMVALPALVEEWLDRGVLWVALSRITTVRTTIFASALLFGFSHGLNGGALLEVPHRFAVGLVLAWLRHHTGSLWPPILAHATLNGLAVLL